MFALKNIKLSSRIISNSLKGSTSIGINYSTTILSSAPLNVNTYLSKKTNISMLQSQYNSKRSIFIDTESTPNPQSMKFLPGQEILAEKYGTGRNYQRSDNKEISKSPLAKALFQISGVKGVFLGREFITITKESDEAWQIMKPQVFSKILDFLAEGKPVVLDEIVVSDTTILDTDDEIVATIKELLETKIRPSVQEDGGDIFYKGFNEETGIVTVKLAGSCVGCPSSSITLKNGVENMLMHYIPEVKGIAQEFDEDENEQSRSLNPNADVLTQRKDDVTM